MINQAWLPGPAPCMLTQRLQEGPRPVLAPTQRHLRREFWDSALGYEVFTSDVVLQLHSGNSLSQKD